MDLVVRAATAADVPAMHEVRLAVRENRLTDPPQITLASYQPYVAQGAAWVAELGGEIVGFSAVDRSAALVWALFVSPSSEGKGVGRALMVAAVDWARREEISELRLQTATGSRAERFYARSGWLEEGLTDDGQTRFRLPLFP